MENPYALGNSGAPQQPLVSDGAFNRTLFALKETRPWVRFMGILTAIGAALTGIGSVFALFAAAIGNVGVGLAVLIMAAYAFIAVVYGFAAKFLLGYASAISRAEGTRNIEDVADAIELQKSFWKLIGTCTAIFLVLYLVFIVVMIFGAFAFLPRA